MNVQQREWFRLQLPTKPASEPRHSPVAAGPHGHNGPSRAPLWRSAAGANAGRGPVRQRKEDPRVRVLVRGGVRGPLWGVLIRRRRYQVIGSPFGRSPLPSRKKLMLRASPLGCASAPHSAPDTRETEVRADTFRNMRASSIAGRKHGPRAASSVASAVGTRRLDVHTNNWYVSSYITGGALARLASRGSTPPHSPLKDGTGSAPARFRGSGAWFSRGACTPFSADTQGAAWRRRSAFGHTAGMSRRQKQRSPASQAIAATPRRMAMFAHGSSPLRTTGSGR